MRRFAMVSLLLVALVVAVLAIPYLLRDNSSRPLTGPRLDQLTYQTVAFENGDLDLAGMLFLPEGDGPFAGAVIIHGSGTSRRDNPWYLSVAAELQANGVAVLLPDKRGSEGSDGEWRDTGFEELATDTQAAFEFLAGIPGVDAGRIGVVGMSQGGWIAPIVASRNRSVAFVVSMSGAGVTTEEQLQFEEVNNIVQMGTYRFVARMIAAFTVPRIQRTETWRATAGFDPMPYWAGVDAPVFVALGGGDTNVPVQESVSRFTSLPYTPALRVYPNGGHAIWDPETGRVQQAFLDDLVSFVSSVQAN